MKEPKFKVWEKARCYLGKLEEIIIHWIIIDDYWDYKYTSEELMLQNHEMWLDCVFIHDDNSLYKDKQQCIDNNDEDIQEKVKLLKECWFTIIKNEKFF